MSEGNPPVFLTYGWCRVSFVILHSLAARGVEVHVGDASRLAMCRWSRRAASFTRLPGPWGGGEAYAAAVGEAVRRTGAKVVIPGHEDALLLARHRDLLPPGTLLPVGPAEDLERLNDKGRLVEAARAAGVPVPETFFPASREDLAARAPSLRYPVVVKTRLGNSGKGVFPAADPEESLARFDAAVERFRIAPHRLPMIQEFLPGRGYGVCLLYDRGECRASFAERYLRCKDGEFGTSVLREGVRAPALVAAARALLDAARWHGVAHLDFIVDEGSGRTGLIEVNPRFWGALDLAVRSGVDFPWLLYRMALDGRAPEAGEARPDLRSRWLVGEGMALFNEVRRLRLRAAASVAFDQLFRRADGNDDFRWRDPLPLLFEGLWYGTRLLASGSVNPVEEGMIG